jgi:hypothetical protein
VLAFQADPPRCEPMPMDEVTARPVSQLPAPYEPLTSAHLASRNVPAADSHPHRFHTSAVASGPRSGHMSPVRSGNWTEYRPRVFQDGTYYQELGSSWCSRDKARACGSRRR